MIFRRKIQRIDDIAHAARDIAFFMKQGSQANWDDFKSIDSFLPELRVRRWPRSAEPQSGEHG